MLVSRGRACEVPDGCARSPQGADPNVHDRDAAELYGVHYAAMQGHEAVLETLLALGAQLNVSAGTGDGVLHYAAEGGQVAMIRKLVESMGVGVETEGFGDTTPLFSAVRFLRMCHASCASGGCWVLRGFAAGLGRCRMVGWQMRVEGSVRC